MWRLVLVCVGGGIGSGLRYVTVVVTQRAFGSAFPWGVFVVNVVGSFLMAFVTVLAVTKASLSEEARLAITAGFLGGLTTYSSFNQDLLAMADARALGRAVSYLVVTLAACLVAGLLGTAAGRRI